MRAQSGDIFLGLDLTSRIAPRRHVDFLTWRTKGVLVAFVAYDMLPILNPKWFTPRALKSFRHWLSTLAVHADSILCISESVAADTRNVMRNHFDLVDNDITIRWFHLGAHFSSRHTSTSAALPPIRKRRCGPRSVDVLMVGTVEPRKGYSQVIDAFDLLWTNGVDATLTIAGKQGWCVDVLAERITEHPEYGSRLFWRSQIDDIELAQLYSHSDGLIMASEAEGFGLPLIEAARFGTPVLARDLRVFREVAGEHAEYFHGRDGVELMPQLATWLVRLENGVARSSAGMTSLTWSQSANQLRALLAELKPRAEVDSASHEFIGDASL